MKLLVRQGGQVEAWLREVTIHSFVYAVGAVLQAVLNFALLPLYTKQLSPEEFGIFRLAVLAASLAGAVFYLGAYSSLTRFYFDSSVAEERKTAAGTAAILTLFGGTLQMVVIALLATPTSSMLLGSPDYALHLVLALATSALTFINQIFLLMLRLQRRSVAVVAINVCALFGTVAAVLALVLFWPQGVIGALAAGLIGQAVVTPALVWLARDAFAWRLGRAQARQQLAFGLPALVIGLGYYALDSAGRFMFARMGTLSDLGILAFGYTIGMVVQMLFVQPFGQIWNPMRLEYRNHPDSARLSALVGTYYALAGLAFVAGISLFAPELVAILGTRSEYAEAKRIVPIILISHLVYGAISLVDLGIHVRNRLRYHVAIFWVSVGINLALNYVLIPRFGYMGSAWATLVSYTLLVGATYVVSRRLVPVSFEPGRLGLTISSAGAVIVLGTWLSEPGWIGIIGRLALLAGLFAVWHLLVLTDGERAWIRQKLSHLRSSEN